MHMLLQIGEKGHVILMHFPVEVQC